MNYFQIAWDIANEANKNFNYYGGAKQYFNEALRLAHAGYTKNDLISVKSKVMTERLSESDLISSKNLNGLYFLVTTTKGQFVFNTMKNILLSKTRYATLNF